MKLKVAIGLFVIVLFSFSTELIILVALAVGIFVLLLHCWYRLDRITATKPIEWESVCQTLGRIGRTRLRQEQPKRNRAADSEKGRQMMMEGVWLETSYIRWLLPMTEFFS